jgi:glycosyltransferase involved in cell wall biosynthesis
MSKKVLIICPHPENVAPGQRLKYEQYFEDWRTHGYKLKVSSFMTLRFWNIVYKKGYFFEKVFWTVIGYIKRIGTLFLIPFYDVTYVFLWGTPFGASLYERLIVLLSSKLVYDIDDMVFLGHSSDANKSLQRLKGKRKMIYLMKNADHVITCTPTLDKFVKQYNINTTDISSTVDTENRYIPINQYKNNHQLIIGWSGSHSTSKYLYLLSDILKRLAHKYDFKLIVMGDKTFTIDGVNIEAYDWSESIEIKTLQKFDIGLYPLPDEEWVYGKSGLKAIQYMALGIPTIATAIGANYRIIENDINGFLITTKDYEEWETIIEKLLINPDLRKRIGEQGRNTIIEKYSVTSNKSKYRQILDSF